MSSSCQDQLAGAAISAGFGIAYLICGARLGAGILFAATIYFLIRFIRELDGKRYD